MVQNFSIFLNELRKALGGPCDEFEARHVGI